MGECLSREPEVDFDGPGMIAVCLCVVCGWVCNTSDTT